MVFADSFEVKKLRDAPAGPMLLGEGNKTTPVIGIANEDGTLNKLLFLERNADQKMDVTIHSAANFENYPVIVYPSCKLKLGEIKCDYSGRRNTGELVFSDTTDPVIKFRSGYNAGWLDMTTYRIKTGFDEGDRHYFCSDWGYVIDSGHEWEFILRVTQ